MTQLIAARRRISPCLFRMCLLIAGCVASCAVLAVDTPVSRATVTAEALAQELVGGEQVALINAAMAPANVDVAEPKRVYYSTTLSVRAATVAAQRDRQAGKDARVLLGNDVQWASSRLPHIQGTERNGPVKISPAELAQALADSVDMQLVDIRARERFDVATIANADWMLPHDFEADMERFSNRRWLLLIDQGDGVADALARAAFARGHVLVAVIDGGFPAWAASEHH